MNVKDLSELLGHASVSVTVGIYKLKEETEQESKRRYLEKI